MKKLIVLGLGLLLTLHPIKVNANQSALNATLEEVSYGLPEENYTGSNRAYNLPHFAFNHQQYEQPEGGYVINEPNFSNMYIQVMLNSPRAVSGLSMFGRNGSSTIKGFELMGSSNGSTFVKLFEGELERSGTSQEFLFENDVEYLYYKINILSTHGGVSSFVSVQDIRLFSWYDPNPTPPDPTPSNYTYLLVPSLLAIIGVMVYIDRKYLKEEY